MFRQPGMLAENTVRSDGAPQYDARFGHGGRNDGGIGRLLRKALMEEVRLRTPRRQCCFHRGRGNGHVEKSERRLIGLQFSRHRGTALLRWREVMLPSPLPVASSSTLVGMFIDPPSGSPPDRSPA